jgi:hypothetical protein
MIKALSVLGLGLEGERPDKRKYSAIPPSL